MRTNTFAAPQLSRRTLLAGVCASGIAATATTRFATGALAASFIDAENYVVSTGAELIAAAKIGTAAAFKSLLQRHVDLTAFALFALGHYRSDLPSSRHSEYIGLVTTFMANTMSFYAEKFVGNSFDVQRSRPNGEGYIVESRMKFLGGRNHESVKWKLVPSGNSFKVSDIYFKQLWLGVVLRDTFTSEIQSNGGSAESIITYLRNAANSGSGTTF
jgi:ABC-type transporter MlaC component